MVWSFHLLLLPPWSLGGMAVAAATMAIPNDLSTGKASPGVTGSQHRAMDTLVASNSTPCAISPVGSKKKKKKKKEKEKKRGRKKKKKKRGRKKKSKERKKRRRRRRRKRKRKRKR